MTYRCAAGPAGARSSPCRSGSSCEATRRWRTPRRYRSGTSAEPVICGHAPARLPPPRSLHCARVLVTARIGVITFPGSLDDQDAAPAVRPAGGSAVPPSHGERALHRVAAVVAAAATLSRLEERGEVVARSLGASPNGSAAGIAGGCSEDGGIVGLMPHPEHALDAVTGPGDGGPGFFNSVVRGMAKRVLPACR